MEIKVNTYIFAITVPDTLVNYVRQNNDCDPNPSQNNGTCLDGIATYACLCDFGYTSTKCETVVDFCQDDPSNNGSCTSVEAMGFLCECEPEISSIIDSIERLSICFLMSFTVINLATCIPNFELCCKDNNGVYTLYQF